jgi:hypothetical protein
MKNLTLFILFTLHLSLFTLHLSAQPCLPEGITFTTQAQIDNFQTNYPNCTEIEGHVEIKGENITNLNGLNVITAISGYVYISYTALTNLNGLNSLTNIGEFFLIAFNDSLSSLAGLENLTTIEGTFDIGDSFAGGNPKLINLTGLDNLSYIGGDLRIYDNLVLTSLTGLENLKTINGGLVIGGDPTSWGDAGNPSLKNISALVNISHLNTTLRILYNDSLTNLDGLDGLVSIGSDLWIEGNGSLSSLNGLENLSFIGDCLAINNNPELVSIDGIKNIEANSILNLHVRDNSLLETCAVRSICDYLANPNGEIDIQNNAPGCNSREEVEEACTESVDEVSIINNLSIYPNPFSNSITIEFELNQLDIVTLIIYKHLGEKVETIKGRKSVGQQKTEWNCAEISAGIYFCVLKINKGIQTIKIIKL